MTFVFSRKGAAFCAAVLITCYILHKMTHIPPLKCLYPLRIRNKYTGDWMFVPCRKCEVCLINNATSKAYHLSQDFRKYPFILFVTLTYDNDSLPYMMVDDCRVFRGRFPPAIIGYNSFVNDTVKMPKNFHSINSLGVLHKKDLQDFFKRLRINYERKTGNKFCWKYNSVGEYGSVGKRPHYHIAFYGFKAFPNGFRDVVIKSWPFCDWSRLDMDKTFEYSSSSISNYLASYINSYINIGDVFSEKDVKPFIVRSKDISFGVGAEIRKNFENAVKKGLSNAIIRGDKNPVEFYDKSKLSVSTRLIPKKYLSALFTLPAGLRQTDFVNKCRVCERVFAEPKKINTDYSFYLSYTKYCKLLGIVQNDVTLTNFVRDSDTFNNYYRSCIIKQSMLEYDKNSPSSYYASRINTCVDDMDKRSFRLQCRGVDADPNFIQGDYSDYFKNFLFLYGKKLISKHLNEL